VTDDHLKIYVDATRPATLNDGAGKQRDFATLEAAVVLPWVGKVGATVKQIGGPVYVAHQIGRLDYGPKRGSAKDAAPPPGGDD
jgi:hypothetical protein